MNNRERLILIKNLCAAAENENVEDVVIKTIRDVMGSPSSTDIITKEEFTQYLGYLKGTANNRTDVVKSYKNRTGCSLVDATNMFPDRTSIRMS